MTINNLPDNVFVGIFSLCRMDEVGHITRNRPRRPWKWQRLAHVCRTWRQIMFASAFYLHLELLCTNGTPVRKNIGYLPALPIAISYSAASGSNLQGDRYNLFAALKHRDRVRVIEVNVPRSVLDELATMMQEPFPALQYLRFESEEIPTMPALPDTFLGGSAPHLQTIHMSGIPFPAAPPLFLSAHDLTSVHLRNIPPAGHIPLEAMVASLAALPRLRNLTLGFKSGMLYPNRTSPPPIIRTVLPALTTFYFKGLSEYLEDLLAQVDAPRLNHLQIAYLRQDKDAIFQIPQLCKFIDYSEKLKSFQFTRADILIRCFTIVIELFHRDRSSFRLSIQTEEIGRVVSQIPATLSSVSRLFVSSVSRRPVDPDQGDGAGVQGERISWLGLFRPFTAVKALSVDRELSEFTISTLSRVSEVVQLPALELLCLEGQSLLSKLLSVREFVAARQNIGRPVTVVNDERVFREKLNALNISN